MKLKSPYFLRAFFAIKSVVNKTYKKIILIITEFSSLPALRRYLVLFFLRVF